MVILQASLTPKPIIATMASPPLPLSRPPSDHELPLCLTPQEERVVVQDYSAVSVSEQLWVRHQPLNQSSWRGTLCRPITALC